MQQFFDSMKTYISEKASSPLLPAFTLSWCICNYEVWVYLFSKAPPELKISGVRSSLELNSVVGALETFLLPLVAALFYVYVYPHIARKIIKYTEGQKNEIKSAVIEARKDTPRSTPEYNRMKAELEKVKAETSNQIWELTSKLEEERTRIQELTQTSRNYLHDYREASEAKKKLERELQSARDSVLKHETKRDEYKRTIKNLELSVSTRNVEYASLERKLEDTTSVITAKDSLIAELRGDLGGREKQTSEMVKLIEFLKNEVSSKDGTIVGLNAKLDEFTDKLTKSNRELAESSLHRTVDANMRIKLEKLLEELHAVITSSTEVPNGVKKAISEIKSRYAPGPSGIPWKSARGLKSRKDDGVSSL